MKKFSFLFAALFAAMSMFAADATITGVTNGYDDFTINGSPAVKIGTSSKGGDLTVTVGAGATSLSLHAVAWKGVSGLSLNITAPTGVTITPASIALTASDVIQGNSKVFTLDNADDFKFDFAISGADEGATFTFTTSIAKRFIMWDATYEVGGTPAPVVEYYLVGTMNSWVPAEGYKFSKNTGATGLEYKLDVTLDANDEFKVRKVVDGTEDAWYPDNCGECNKVVETAGDYTIYFRPNADGGDDWHHHVILAEYHEPVVLPTYTCADVQANEATDEGNLNPVTVLFVKNSNIFVKDETGMTQVYLSNNGLQVGDVVSGIVGHSTLYNNVPEFLPSNTPNDWTVEHGTVVYDEKAEVPIAANVNGVYKFKDVTFDANYSFIATGSIVNANATIAGETIVLRNNYKLVYEFSAAKIYDVVAVVVLYNGNPQLYFVSAVETGEIPHEGPDHFLAGWINGDYYCYDEDEESVSEYKFDIRNRITVTFQDDADILVRTYEDTPKFYGAETDVVLDEENFQVTLTPGNEGMVRIPKYREATIEISIDESNVMTMTVTLAHAYTCAEINTAEDDQVANLNPATVVYVGEGDSKYCYVADASGMTLIYMNGHGLSEGQLVSGIKGTVDIFSGLPELKPSNNPDKWHIGVGEIPDFVELAEVPTAEMVNQIIVLKGVSVSANVEFTDATVGDNVNANIGNGTIVLRNAFRVNMTLAEGTYYDIKGAVSVNNGTVQFYVISAEEAEAPVVEKDYYLVGFFEGADVLDNREEYKFQNGRLTVTFATDAYFYIQDSENHAYHAAEYVPAPAAGNIYIADLDQEPAHTEKVLIPANREATIYIEPLGEGVISAQVELTPLPEVYSLAGDFNNWNNNDDDATFELTEGVYRLELAEIAGEFKVVSKGKSNWLPQAGGPSDANPHDSLTIGEPYAMTVKVSGNDGADPTNLKIAPDGIGYHNAVLELTIDLTSRVGSITLVSGERYDMNEHPTYQIVGAFNEWDIQTAIEFEEVEGVLTAEVPALVNGFKIVKNHVWHPQYGANESGAGLVFNEPYVLGGEGQDGEADALVMLIGYNNAVLTLDPETMTLTLVGGESMQPAEPEYRLVGSMTNWELNEDEQYLFVRNEEAEGDVEEYKLEITLEENDEFKVKSGENWYPEGGNNNFLVDADHAGEVIISFRPNYDGGADWHEGCIFVAPKQAPCQTAYQIKAGENTIDMVDNPGNGTEVMALDIELQAGTQLKLYEVCSEAEFVAENNNGYQFEIVEGAYVVAEDGIYSFYLAPAYENNSLYVSKYMGPTSKAADPEWPALQVKAVYSDTYEADCNFGEWGSGTQYEQTEYGKHYTTTDLGYFGLAFEDRTLNCSNMEALHLDVWSETDMSMRVVPIYASDADMGITINITAGQWEPIELPFTSEEWANMGEHWSNIYQIKIDNAPNRSFWLDNVYFYTSQAPEEDHDAPTGLQAQVVAESYFSAVIEAVAEDNSGEVVYSVVNGGLMIASASGNSGVPVQITVKELQGGDEYHFNVVARDPQGNDAEPVEVTVNTLATPEPAPQPAYAAENVKSVYSAYYEQAVEFGYQDWYMGATQSEGDLAQNNFAMCYVPKDAAGACFGWAFAATDITAYDKFEMDVYAVEDGALDFALIDATPRTVHQLGGGQWNHIVIDIAGNEKTDLTQLGFYENQNSGTFFVQNAMFVKEPVVYNYFMVGDFCDWEPANAVQFVPSNEENLLGVVLDAIYGGFKIVRVEGETAQWGDEFGAFTQGDVIAMDPQGEYILKHMNAENLNIEGRYNNAVFTLEEIEGAMVLHFIAGTIDENIYFSLAGDFNNWNNNDDDATFAVVEDKLRLELEEIHGEFKVVVKGDWHPQAGGPVGAEEKDVLTLGEAYNMTLALVDGQPDASNLLIAEPGKGYHNAVLELTADLSTATVSITLVSGDIYDLPTDVYYMAGEAVGWNPTAAKFEEVEGVLTLEVADFWGDFKLTAGAWHPQYGAPVGVTTDSIQLGVPYQLTMCDDSQGEADIENVHTALEEGYRYADAKFTLEVAEDGTLTITLVEGTPYDHSGAPKTYQLVGAFNGWKEDEAPSFEEIEGVLTITIEDLSGTFKVIQDHGWANQWATNWETGARLALNEPYVLGGKVDNTDPANLALVKLFSGYRNAVLTLDPETMTLTLVSGEEYRVEADWYVPGAWQGAVWKCDVNSKMSPVEGQENTFELLQPEFGKAFKVVYGEWMVEFGAAVGSGATWMLDQDIDLAFPCENLNSAYGDQMLQDVTITIVVDYENGAVSLNITSDGEVQPTLYYIKNNWNGEAEWTWQQMTPSNNGDEWMFEGVFGGTGVNINTAMSDEGQLWFPVGEAYEGHVIEGDDIQAGQTVRFVYSVSANTVTATVVETGIENVVLDAVKAQKMLIDGHIYIIRDGRMFNVQGARVR